MALMPSATFRSPTAVEGKSDLRDENVYSAILLQHGGAGQQKIFTVPSGQTIPGLRGAGINTSVTQVHQQTYSELTTNLTKSGELGSAIGDAAVRAIGGTIEQAAYTVSGVNAGAQRLFGATQFEIADILSKCFFQFKVAGKLQIQGPLFSFPSVGAAFGAVSSTGSGAVVSIGSNGWPGNPRRLKLPILVARTDTLEGVFGVAGGAALAFSTTSGDGQPCLVWMTMATLVKGDVR
jgi:hypothetical protein